MTGRDFTDRVAVITGAAGGFGRALCKRFGAGGARIVGLDLNEKALNELKEELEEAGIEAAIYPCDLTIEKNCNDGINYALAKFGRIDLLYNNAGISHRSAFCNTDVSVIRRVMEVNFFSAVYCTKAALDSLIENKGMIITMSSIAGFAPLIARTGYSASKHALHGFFDSLRTELEDQGVKVMIVCPSFVKTGIDQRALGGDGKPASQPRQQTGKPGLPEEQAEIIFQAACREKQLLLPSTMSTVSYWIHKFCPGFYVKKMVDKLRKEMETR